MDPETKCFVEDYLCQSLRWSWENFQNGPITPATLVCTPVHSHPPLHVSGPDLIIEVLLKEDPEFRLRSLSPLRFL